MSIVQWVKQQPTFNTNGEDAFSTIAVDPSGNSYVAYQSTGAASGQNNTGREDIVVFKLDTSGNTLWVKQQPTFNTTQGDYIPSIAVDHGGNSYVTYTTSGTVLGQTRTGLGDTVVFKLDTSGVLQWAKQQNNFNTTGNDNHACIAVDSVGNSYIAYQTDGTVSGQNPTGSHNIAVFKLNGFGVLQWIKQQPIFSINSYPYTSIGVDSLGNSYVTCQTDGAVPGQTNAGLDDIVVLKLDPSGNVVWIKQQPTFNTNGLDNNPYIAVDSNGNSHVVYSTNGIASTQTNSGSDDIVVFKLDTSGNVLWVRQQPTFNTNGYEIYASIAVDSAGNSFVAYQTNKTVSGQTHIGLTYDIVVLKLDSSGNISGVTQQPTFNTFAADEYPSIAVDSNGNPHISYRTSGTVSGQTYTGGSSDIVVFKLAPNLCVAGNTQILLSDGKTKKITDIQRGDFVINSKGEPHKVCRVCRETIDSRSLIDLVVISPNALGSGQPEQQLIVTPNHPVFYKGCRRPAKCLQKLHGIKLLNRVVAGNFLGEGEAKSTVFLYDLQFETDGSYIANGLEVQSRCPYSDLTPLPKELYYDESLYHTELVWDSYNQSLPLDVNILWPSTRNH